MLGMHIHHVLGREVRPNEPLMNLAMNGDWTVKVHLILCENKIDLQYHAKWNTQITRQNKSQIVGIENKNELYIY